MLEPEKSERSKRDLADALRELRRAAGLSGERLAARAAMSQSKISRIESGKILPTVVDVERILNALNAPPDIANELLATARVVNVDYTSFRSVARTGLWRGQEEIKALTESAATIRQFLPAIPSGLIQTADYARAVVTPIVKGRPARDVERMVQARMDSQEVLNDESRQFFFLLTEQAVRWRHSGPTTMLAQLQNMRRVADQSNMHLAILPQRVVANAAPMNTFVIYDERLVRAKLFSGEVALRDPQDISYHLNLFEHFWQYALTGDRAIEFLDSVAEEFMRELD